LAGGGGLTPEREGKKVYRLLSWEKETWGLTGEGDRKSGGKKEERERQHTSTPEKMSRGKKGFLGGPRKG